MDQVREQLDALIERANLPPAIKAVEVAATGLDNVLTLVHLAGGRKVLLRRPREPESAARPRWDLLRSLGVSHPVVYAIDDAGTALMEWIDGQPLIVRAREPKADGAWRATGVALADVHRVRFPGAVEGEFEHGALRLSFVDWSRRLTEQVDSARGWAHLNIRNGDRLLQQVTDRFDSTAAEISRDGSRLLHGDICLDNVIVSDESSVLIDWDTPRVGTRFSELAALEEHHFLACGAPTLPAAFWQGYGEVLSEPALLMMRTIGCLSWLASDDWNSFAEHPTLTSERKAELAAWKPRLRAWVNERAAGPT